MTGMNCEAHQPANHFQITLAREVDLEKGGRVIVEKRNLFDALFFFFIFFFSGQLLSLLRSLKTLTN